MQKKGKKAPLTAVVIALIAVLVLTFAGTVLRMQSRDMGFADAFASFMADTFTANQKK